MKTLLMLIFSTLFATNLMAKSYILKSPDNKLQVNVEISDEIRFSVNHEQTEVIAPSPVSMRVMDGRVWGEKPRLKSKKTQSVNQTVVSTIYKKKEIPDIYNEMILSFKGNYSMIFRAYDQGWLSAYSYCKDSIWIHEEVNFNSATIPHHRTPSDKTPLYLKNSFSIRLKTHTHSKLSELDKRRLVLLPLVVELNDGRNMHHRPIRKLSVFI